MRLAIDFDGVIHDYKNPVKKMGPPITNAIESLDSLYQDGHYIIIHTVKANTASGRKAVADWLEFFSVDYHEIQPKPEADLYIDDKAFLFRDWDTILDKLEKEDG